MHIQEKRYLARGFWVPLLAPRQMQPAKHSFDLPGYRTCFTTGSKTWAIIHYLLLYSKIEGSLPCWQGFAREGLTLALILGEDTSPSPAWLLYLKEDFGLQFPQKPRALWTILLLLPKPLLLLSWCGKEKSRVEGEDVPEITGASQHNGCARCSWGSGRKNLGLNPASCKWNLLPLCTRNSVRNPRLVGELGCLLNPPRSWRRSPHVTRGASNSPTVRSQKMYFFLM